MLPADIRALSRHLSRTVYLLLYVLMFCDLTIGILPGTPHHRAIYGPAVEFQSYLAYGLLALVAIRALSALYPTLSAPYPDIVVHHGSAPIDAVHRNGRLT